MSGQEIMEKRGAKIVFSLSNGWVLQNQAERLQKNNFHPSGL